MTYRDAVNILIDNGVENARFEASLLICKLFSVSEASLPLMREQEFDDSILAPAVEKRAMGYPLQYILGEWGFFGLDFEVNENCLSPRPDTELLVEKAIEILPQNAVFLELCTGSGCIPISICNSRKDVKGVATELYPDTMATAERNAVRNRVEDRINFVLADVFDKKFFSEGEGKKLVPSEGFDAVVSNPPYIPTDDVFSLSREVRHEPFAALDGGADGLDFYREIIAEYKKYLKPCGVMILEIGYDQAEAMKKLAETAGFGCEIFKDLGGNDRVAILGGKGND